MHLFYVPGISGSTCQLDEQESRHCIKVLRLKRGDLVKLVDGIGGLYEARVETEDPRKCLLSVQSLLQKEFDFPYYLHLAIAPTKNMDRFEWLIEKATEFGISEITPLICEHSERKDVKIARLEKVAISAMKQSYKAFLPRINEVQAFSSWIMQAHRGFRGIAHCMEGVKIQLWEAEPYNEQTIAIGPEGDFSAAEVSIAVAQGFAALDLGEARLRTETAGLAVVHGIQLLNGMPDKKTASGSQGG